MITRKCRQCGKEFTLTDSEIEFYNKKGFELPKRCEQCRKSNRSNNNVANSNTSYDYVKRYKVQSHKGIVIPLIIIAAVILLAVVKLPDIISLTRNEVATEVITSQMTTEQKPLTEAVETEKTKTTTSETPSTEKTEEVTDVTYAKTTVPEEEPIIIITTQTTTSIQFVNEEAKYTFRNDKLLEDHFQSHGIDMGLVSAQEYSDAASAVVTN